MSDKPATEYRVEKAGGLTVYYPIRPRPWGPPYWTTGIPTGERMLSG